MNKQQGSAHVIVVGVLVVALLGALGFIFWQNFVKKDEVAKSVEATNKTDSQQEPEEGIKTKQYDGSTYSFSYPSDGWRVVETQNDYDQSNETYPVVQSTNYSKGIGMGIERGATVGVYTTAHTTGETLAQDKENMKTSMPGLESLEDTTLGGIPAYSWVSGYEGYRYATVAIKDGTYYQVVYQFAHDIDQSVHRNGYDTVVETFKFK